jgi:hypothetical protein
MENNMTVYGALAGLRRLADVTPFAVRMRFVVALVFLFLIYCDCVYFASNVCVRYVYRRRLFNHMSDVSDSMLGSSLLNYMEFRLAYVFFGDQ